MQKSVYPQYLFYLLKTVSTHKIHIGELKYNAFNVLPGVPGVGAQVMLSRGRYVSDGEYVLYDRTEVMVW